MKKFPFKVLVALIAVCLLGVICLSYAYFIEPDRLVINRSEIAVPNWNRSFDGLRIVMIGDVHGGSNNVTEAKIRKLVDESNKQNPDLVVLLGDYTAEDRYDNLLMPARVIADNLRGLNARLGVFAVLGNHDGWYSDKKVAAELERVGIRVLQDEIATVDNNGQKLRILGLKDQLKINSWQEYSDKLKQVIAQDGGSGDIVVLEHSPDVLPIITGDLSISPDLRLFLAAHTHGGQVWFPLLGTLVVPSSYGQKYSYGHIRENGVDMFVTSGVGTSVLPIRFMMPPEIVSLTVRTE